MTRCGVPHSQLRPASAATKGGEHDQPIRFVQEIGSHICHTFPHKNGVIIRFISNLYKNNIIFPENRFWWIYGLKADHLKSPQRFGQYIKGFGVDCKGDSRFNGSPNTLSIAVNISAALLHSDETTGIRASLGSFNRSLPGIPRLTGSN
jgi:hypothetical protein